VDYHLAQTLHVLDNDLLSRMTSDGGFGDRPGASTRGDTTAWAILVLQASGKHTAVLARARAKLAEEQQTDGRVCVSKTHPESHWPTALALLAWHGSSEHLQAKDRAVRFLLETTGVHYRRDPDDPVAHDTLIRGWPWVDGTHSWVEPTAIAVWALRRVGHGTHSRVRDAIGLLMNRQLPHGGWNYGNTRVFGQTLDPTPEHTGVALHALAGCVAREQVAASLEYLQSQIAGVQTPIALGWGLLGLRRWDAASEDVDVWRLASHCLARQHRYGGYDTTSLCVLLLSVMTPGGSTHDEVSVDAGPKKR
jgi:hypothetical protein